MKPRALTDDLTELLDEIDRLARRHREGIQYAATAELMGFLHEQLRLLRQRLFKLRAAVDLLLAAGESGPTEVWAQLCTDLRGRAPATLLDPGHAITTMNLDLLRLVAYTSASAALVEERCARLVEQIAGSVDGAAKEQAWRRVLELTESRR